MMNSNQFSNDEPIYQNFTHIYIEDELKACDRAKKILAHFPQATIITIPHYKDMFNRTNQNYMMQKHHKQLILASNHGTLLYTGAPVCQSFGNEHFYYTSNILNCIYDCEYCYLQGMYPSANLVAFLNIEATFAELDALLKEHPVYLCISYDTDLLALEGLFGFVKEWITFAAAHPDLTIEIRTKSANADLMHKLPVLDNVIYAWTLSPQQVITLYEHDTPSLKARMNAVKAAIKEGHKVRLCFDPMLAVTDSEELYSKLADDVFNELDAEKIKDISLGVFRISKEYLKTMRRHRMDSAVVQYPYEQTDGYYHYSSDLTNKLIGHMKEQLSRYVDPSRIFLWTDTVNKEEHL